MTIRVIEEYSVDRASLAELVLIKTPSHVCVKHRETFSHVTLIRTFAKMKYSN